MKPLHIIGKDALIWVIKTNHHTISVVVHAENILVQRLILITDKTGHSITIIQCSNKWSVTRNSVGSNQTFTRQNSKDAINPE